MMSKAAMNLQDSFLNQVRRENSEVNILLVNGKSLRGNVKGFDNFTVILNSRSGQHLIYKHAIAQLVSQRSINMKREGDEGAGSEAGIADELEPAEHKRPAQQNAGREDRSKSRKDGFNTLDLSKVKLGEKEAAEVATPQPE
jgi:host factor-I protein